VAFQIRPRFAAVLLSGVLTLALGYAGAVGYVKLKKSVYYGAIAELLRDTAILPGPADSASGGCRKYLSLLTGNSCYTLCQTALSVSKYIPTTPSLTDTTHAGEIGLRPCCLDARLVCATRTTRHGKRPISAHSSKDLHMASTTGTIKRITDKGFGFIATPDGTEYFFHQSACTSTPFDSLREGENVSFTVGQGPKGPRAENVVPA